jgi:hypothetical protein
MCNPATSSSRSSPCRILGSRDKATTSITT